MKAFRVCAWDEPPALVDVDVPEPGPGEVLVRVAGAGACHSDLHILESGGLMPFPLPFTLGHETTGWVDKLGPGAGGFDVGEAVAVYGPWGCGRCERCRAGAENYCTASAGVLGAAGGGLGRDGGMAEYLLVPSDRLLVALGDVDPVTAAPLTDAGLTPYHAIRRSRERLLPGSTAVVIGCGGLGLMAVQLLRATSAARVVAIDQAEDKLALAREDGADAAFGPADAAGAVRELTGGRGADLVLDFVGAQDTIALAVSCAGVLSHVTIVGLAMGSFGFGALSVPWECSLATVYWGTRPELVELVALAEAGHVRPRIETFPLARAGEAYERMKAGTLAGRAVVTPG